MWNSFDEQRLQRNLEASKHAIPDNVFFISGIIEKHFVEREEIRKKCIFQLWETS